MSTDRDATGEGFPGTMRTNLHLPERDVVGVEDIGSRLSVLRLGDDGAEVAVFARQASDAREVAEAATVWAELSEARERGEDVALWGGWVLPADTFGGAR